MFDRGGWLQVCQLPERAGSGSFTLAVYKIDDRMALLTSLDIDTRQRSSGDNVKTVIITGPDGNHIAFAEPFDTRVAR